ncbi:MAG: hypothetical protein ACKVQA_07020 [Burkholderiales bacterium]
MAMPMAAMCGNASAQATSSPFGRRKVTLFSDGASLSTTALMSEQGSDNRALIAPSFGTKDDTAARSVFAKRTRLLMRSGLIRGITPMSIRNGSGQGWLALASSPLDGDTSECADGGREQKADY